MNVRILIVLFSLLCCFGTMQAQEDQGQGCPARVTGEHWIRVTPRVILGKVRNKVLPNTADLTDEHSEVHVTIEINKAGSVVCARATEGHPDLYLRSVRAARQWTFEPFVLNGNAINVESHLVFRFSQDRVTALFPN